MFKKKKVISLIAIILSLVFILSLIVFLYVYKLNQTLQEESDFNLHQISTQSAKTLNRQLEGDLHMLQSMAVVLGGKEELDVDYWVDKFGKDPVFEQFQRIGIILPDGAGYGQDVTGTNFSDRIYFQQAMRGTPYISDPMIDRITSVYSYTYAVPIYHQGKITCVLAAVTNMDTLQGLLFDKPFMDTGRTYIARQDGEIVLSSKGSMEFTNLFNRINEDSDTRKELLSQMESGGSGTLRCPMQEGVVFVSYVPLDINNWYVITTLSEQAVQIRSNKILAITATATGVAAGVTLLALIALILLNMRSREKLYRLAYYDKLTGLGNKNNFVKLVPKLLGASHKPYAYCILDIKRFQMINDRFGYSQGDRLLCHVAEVLMREIKPDETAARFNADVFHLLLHMDSSSELTDRLGRIADEIGEYPFLSAKNYPLYVGFGVYDVDFGARSAASMGDMAKLALNRQREQLSNTINFFSETLQDKLLEAQDLENAMRQSLVNDEFHVYLQPQYRLEDEKLAGAEALVRWNHPDKGLITPDRFIPLFEKNGFIAELDLYMFSKICKIIKQWQACGRKPIPISVNQSRLNLFTPGYPEQIIEIFRKHDIDPKWLKIEITENAFFDDTDRMASIINQFHTVGFDVSMDDFGTGYSTLNLLQHLVLDELKLDKQFFKESADSSRGRKIVRNIISMARDLNMTVVAEGVENAVQVNFLSTCGCDFVQGYYYAKPMPVTEFEKLAKL